MHDLPNSPNSLSTKISCNVVAIASSYIDVIYVYIEPKRTGDASKGKKRIMKDDKSEKVDGPTRKKRKPAT